MLILVIVAIGFVFLLMPKYKAIYSGSQIMAEQTKYDKKLKYLEELRNVRRIYDEIKPEDKAKINQIVDNTNDRVELITEFNYIVSSNNANAITDPQLADVNFRVDPISDNKRSGKLNRKIMRTSVNISGVAYPDLLKIVRVMETNLRLMDIDKIEYYPQRNAALLEVLTYQIQ